MQRSIGTLLIGILSLIFTGCGKDPWNNPYPREEAKANIRYSSFTSPPKTLDPARSYSYDETIFTEQIYEPPLQYHYLKRPYTLTTLTATELPKIYYLNAQGKVAPETASDVAFTVYEISIKPGILYQRHPAFAKDNRGNYYYHHLKKEDFKNISSMNDFKYTASRELVADDYVYEIKRLAAPKVNSPIYGLMASKIQGLSEYAALLKKNVPPNGGWLDLRRFSFPGAQATDRYHYKIILKGKYPQFIYWLALPFFAPIPWEADAFYSQEGMAKKNITFDWFPVGTGPYSLVENNPNRRMVLQRNYLFHPEYYPSEGEPGDEAAGYLKLKGQRLPFIDRAVYTLEKESIPRWNKFLQGYYDQSAIGSDSFDQAIQIGKDGRAYLTPVLKKKGIVLRTSITQAISYMGFNMLDAVVGGKSERARRLRLAISIAVDFEEYINIFLNGRGVPAQGPLPPPIFGYVQGEQGINREVYIWKNKQPVRKSIDVAKRLLAEAGYPSGIDPKTGNPLILNYDVATTSGPEEKDLLAWIREQFAKIGIQLNIRNTEYNRFQEKMRLGEGQIFTWGWIADYPDPENFFFLLYGPNSKALFGGENATNYQNKAFDILFDQMKNLPNDQSRQDLINKMLDIIRHDAPWIWGVYLQDFTLYHQWNWPSKPNVMANNLLKYQKLDPLLRAKLRRDWNQKVLWPFFVFLAIWILISLPVIIRYQQKERTSVKSIERNKKC